MTRKKNDDGAAPDKRRARGDGGLYWDEKRQRWRGEITVGYRPDGRRITRKVSDPDKTKALRKLKDLQREIDDAASVDAKVTLAEVMRDWLAHGLPGRSAKTMEKNADFIDLRIIPAFGERKKLCELTAPDVEAFLEEQAEELSTATLRELHSALRRAIRRAQRRDKVDRNVAELCETPPGRDGRPSKSLTFAQAAAVLKASERSPLHAYVVLSLLTGARTEEMRSLRWDHVDLTGKPDANPPIPPHLMVWRSVRAKGETKTKKSRRTIALPERAVEALARHGELQNLWRAQHDRPWSDDDLVFITTNGTELDAHNVRREFRAIVGDAGLNSAEWTPREMRHSFVSLLSDAGVPVEDISRLVGHSGTSVTETVYRHQIRPVIRHGAEVMDRLFPRESDQ
jgi:integrase